MQSQKQKSLVTAVLFLSQGALRWRGGRPQRYLPGDISTTAENSASSSSLRHSLLKRSAKSNIESRRNPAPVDVWNKSKHMRALVKCCILLWHWSSRVNSALCWAQQILFHEHSGDQTYWKPAKCAQNRWNLLKLAKGDQTYWKPAKCAINRYNLLKPLAEISESRGNWNP